MRLAQRIKCPAQGHQKKGGKTNRETYYQAGESQATFCAVAYANAVDHVVELVCNGREGLSTSNRFVCTRISHGVLLCQSFLVTSQKTERILANLHYRTSVPI